MYFLRSKSLIVLILSLCSNQAHQNNIKRLKTDESDAVFDIIVLSQEWPITHCKFYKHDLNPKGRCILPERKNQWTVHGIWPRKGNYYPEFCNKSWHFDPKEIKSIERDLHVAHIQIYKESNDYVFWDHEWQRHGTCAATFEPFNTQLKYFNKSIEWNQKYYLSDMLENANIYPSDKRYIKPEIVVNAVKAATEKRPMIGCYVIDGVTYLQEIRICLDRAFKVIDCNRYAIDKNCHSSKGLIYPKNN